MSKIEVNSERWLNPKKLSSREKWKKLSILPDEYKVSNFGRVRKKCAPGIYKILYAVDNGRQYYTVSIKHKKYYIHRLVALAFIPNPNNYPEIDHIDGKKSNYVKNLRWVNRKMNMENPVTKEKRLVAFSKQKIKIEQVDNLGNITNSWPSIKEAAAIIGVTKNTMSSVSKTERYIGKYKYRRAT